MTSFGGLIFLSHAAVCFSINIYLIFHHYNVSHTSTFDHARMLHWWKTAVVGFFSSSSCSFVWASVVHAAGVCGETPCTPSLISLFLHLLGACEALCFSFCPFYFQSPSLSLSHVVCPPNWPWHLLVSPLLLFSLLLILFFCMDSSWNIPSNLIGKNKGISF